MSVIRKVEAILFASSKRLTVEEIKELIETPATEIETALEELKKFYDSLEISIILEKNESTWKLSVKDEYLPLVEKLMPSTDLPTPVIETLAIIAWKSPVLQSDIIKVRSASAYEHVAELEKLGLVRRTKEGRSYIVKLTEKFYEYFDVPKKAVEELVETTKVPEEEEVVLESDEEKKNRLLKEIRANKINPEEIIGRDKEYLEEFDRRLEEIDNEEIKVEKLPEEVVEEVIEKEEEKNESRD